MFSPEDQEADYGFVMSLDAFLAEIDAIEAPPDDDGIQVLPDDADQDAQDHEDARAPDPVADLDADQHAALLAKLDADIEAAQVAQAAPSTPTDPSRLERIRNVCAAEAQQREARQRKANKANRLARTDPTALGWREVDRYRAEEGRLLWNEYQRVRYAVRTWEAEEREVRECVRSATPEEAKDRRRSADKVRKTAARAAQTDEQRAEVRAKNAQAKRDKRAAQKLITPEDQP